MSNAKTMTTETTWIQKVLAKLNLNEEGKVGLFKDSLIKTWKKQVLIREREITNLKEKEVEKVEEMTEVLTELQEEMAETFISVDVDQIKTKEGRDYYIGEFDKKCNNVTAKVKRQETEIKSYKDSVSKLIETKEEEISAFKTKLSFLQ